MNCTKCNTSIPDDKMFCPNCGKLNESTKTSHPLGGTSQNPFTLNWHHSNILAFAGSMSIIISFFLSFCKWGSDPRISRLRIFSELTGRLKDTAHYISNGEFGQPHDGEIPSIGNPFIMDSLWAVFILVGLSLFIGSIIVFFFAIKKHTKTSLISLVTGICGLVFLVLYYYSHLTIIRIANGTLDVGFYVLIIGIACLLTFVGKNGLKQK